MSARRALLIERAVEALAHARCDISGFAVGAALQVAEGGPIVSGCNIENSTLNLSLCAERVAIFKALSDGHQQFSELVVVAESIREGFCPPCGACRQIIWEFARSATIVLANAKGEYQSFSPAELLPLGFDSGHLAHVG